MESVISDFIKLLFAFPVAWVMTLGEENKEKKRFQITVITVLLMIWMAVR